VHPCERTGRPEGLYCLWRCTRSPAGLSWCMCVYVRGVQKDLGAGLFFYILYSIYLPYSKFRVYLLYFISCFLYFIVYVLNPICYIRYCILYLLYSILYMYILYIYYVLNSKFYILYLLHILTSILLVPSLCTIFYILLLVCYRLCPKSYMLYSILYLVSTIFNIVYVHSMHILCLTF